MKTPTFSETTDASQARHALIFYVIVFIYTIITANTSIDIAEVPVVSETSVAEDDQELEKVKILKSKIKANIADLPKVLEQINETVARCERFC